MEINLKEFREKGLNMNQQEFAERLNVSQNTVSRWEADPSSLSIAKLGEIAKEFGVDIGDILQPTYIVHEPWSTGNNHAIDIKEKLNEINKEITITKIALDKEEYITYSKYQKFGQEKIDILETVKREGRKPGVAIIGASDSGKSTMINTILGDDTLPAKWTPTTSAGTKLIHINDKPKHMGSDNTAVFKASFDNPLIDTYRLHEEDYFNEHYVARGSRNLILEFGTHEGENFQKHRGDRDYFYTIVSYIDAQILEDCDIWDIPGVEASSNEDLSDDYVANTAKQGADIVIYLSVSNQFMHNFDMQYLKEAIDTLPRYDLESDEMTPFENLFIVASQAHIVTNNSNDNDIKRLMSSRIEEFGKTLPDGYWNKLEKRVDPQDKLNVHYSLKDIQERAFTFDRENEKLQHDFKEAFLNLLEKFSRLRNNKLTETSSVYKENYNQLLIDEVEKITKYIEDSERAQFELDEFLKNKTKYQDDNQKMVKLIKEKGRKYQKDSHKKISDIFDTEVTIENIQQLIEEKNIGKKKSDREQFVTWFQNDLTSKFEDIQEENSRKFSKDINGKLEEIKKENISMSFTNFDFSAAFLGALSSVATVGAFSFYFSTLGNLGGYILTAKVVSVLAGMGIKLGGTATVITWLSTIGGPMTIVIAIAIVVGAVVAKLAGGSWKRSFAKQIVKQFNKPFKSKLKEEQKLVGKTYQQIVLEDSDNYWKDTITAIDEGMFNKELDKEEQELREQASQDSEELKKSLDSIKMFYFNV